MLPLGRHMSVPLIGGRVHGLVVQCWWYSGRARCGYRRVRCTGHFLASEASLAWGEAVVSSVIEKAMAEVAVVKPESWVAVKQCSSTPHEVMHAVWAKAVRLVSKEDSAMLLAVMLAVAVAAVTAVAEREQLLSQAPCARNRSRPPQQSGRGWPHVADKHRAVPDRGTRPELPTAKAP